MKRPIHKALYLQVRDALAERIASGQWKPGMPIANEGELARDLGVSAAEVTEMEQRLTSRDVAFDPAPDTDDEDNVYSPSAYLPHPSADPAIAVEQEQWDEDSADRVATALGSLDERSQQILRSRWMTDKKSTLHELADQFGVSAERIRQIEAHAIKKLRDLVAEPAN